MIELGNNYYTGKYRRQILLRELICGNKRRQCGSFQAKIRLAAANVIDAISIESFDKSIQTLKRSEHVLGSVLAQISLAYCYENGIGVPESKSEAVKYYRLLLNEGIN